MTQTPAKVRDLIQELRFKAEHVACGADGWMMQRSADMLEALMRSDPQPQVEDGRGDLARLIERMDQADIFIENDDGIGMNVWSDLKRAITAPSP